jgi:cellulose synthase/poly-beta-1,6-N-acetylglucosamine synthase-like glycosyltransferase
MESAKGQFLAIFDADFLPPKDFLKRTIPYFSAPDVGFVQTRWGHLNAEYSFFTNLQSLAIDAHFMVEQYARQRAGFFMNFNGTAGVWRRRTIEQAGGWRADTLTEDLDLSYRAQMLGWRGQYLRDVITPAELPVTVNAYRRQQYRWARGSFEVAMRMVPQILRARFPKRVKFEAILHITGYGIHLLMSLLALIYPLVAWLSIDRPALISLFGIAAILNLTALAPTVYFAFSQRELGGAWWKRLPSILFLSVAGSGMMVNSLRAIWHAFFGSQAAFERTPKLDVRGRETGGDARAYPVQVSPVIAWEALFLLFNLNTLRLALISGHYVIGFYAGMFATGLLFLLALTVHDGLRNVLRRRSALRDQQPDSLAAPEPFRSPNA